jgi:hypothetical protein
MAKYDPRLDDYEDRVGCLIGILAITTGFFLGAVLARLLS